MSNPPGLASQSEADTQRKYQYIDNSFRTKFTIAAFVIFILLAVVLLIMDIYLLSSFDYPIQQNTNEKQALFAYYWDLNETLAICLAVVFLVCAISFLFWLYRANKNTHALNPQTKLAFSPTWAWVSYFIPILSLFWPYKSMAEIWRTSSRNASTALLLLWWFSFLFMNFVDSASFKLSIKEPENFQKYLSIDVASNIFGLMAAFLLIKIMHDINKNQRTKYNAMQSK